MVTIAAEIGMAHDGDPSKIAPWAARLKEAGVDVMKLQCHLPEESSPLERWRPGTEPASGESRLDYWTRTAWDVATWRRVGQDIHAAGLEFGCSVFSLEAVDLLRQVPELDIWKIPSGMAEWKDLRAAVGRARRRRTPVWISRGLSRDPFGAKLKQYETLMLCTSLYPCPPSLSALNLLPFLDHCDNQVFGGWSDHTGRPELIYAAIGAGMRVVEVHVDVDGSDTPDSSASWSWPKLCDLVRGIRTIESAEQCNLAVRGIATEPLRRYYMPTRYQGRVAKWHGEGEKP